MTHLNLQQACLLEASGELTPGARRELLQLLAQNPAAHRQYQTIKARLDLLRTLPPHEPSASVRLSFPNRLKVALHLQLSLQNRARNRARLIRYASAAISALAAALILVISLNAYDASQVRKSEQDRVVRLNTLIDRFAIPGDQPSPYDQALNDVEASIRQLQTESPTLANVQDQDMSNLLDVLATVPADLDNAMIPGPG